MELTKLAPGGQSSNFFPKLKNAAWYALTNMEIHTQWFIMPWKWAMDMVNGGPAFIKAGKDEGDPGES